MKKGLRLYYHNGKIIFFVLRRKDWPDEKGIATPSDIPDETKQKLYGVGKIDLMKKGLRPRMTGWKHAVITYWKSERLTWWKRDCDNKFNSRHLIISYKSERLTWWKRDCDTAHTLLQPWQLVFVGKIDLMKKGLRRLLRWGMDRDKWDSGSETLTWWKRDCDFTSHYHMPPEQRGSRKHWPDEKGIATYLEASLKKRL